MTCPTSVLLACNALRPSGLKVVQSGDKNVFVALKVQRLISLFSLSSIRCLTIQFKWVRQLLTMVPFKRCRQHEAVGLDRVLAPPHIFA